MEKIKEPDVFFFRESSGNWKRQKYNEDEVNKKIRIAECLLKSTYGSKVFEDFQIIRLAQLYRIHNEFNPQPNPKYIDKGVEYFDMALKHEIPEAFWMAATCIKNDRHQHFFPAYSQVLAEHHINDNAYALARAAVMGHERAVPLVRQSLKFNNTPDNRAVVLSMMSLGYDRNSGTFSMLRKIMNACDDKSDEGLAKRIELVKEFKEMSAYTFEPGYFFGKMKKVVSVGPGPG